MNRLTWTKSHSLNFKYTTYGNLHNAKFCNTIFLQRLLQTEQGDVSGCLLSPRIFLDGPLFSASSSSLRYTYDKGSLLPVAVFARNSSKIRRNTLLWSIWLLYSVYDIFGLLVHCINTNLQYPLHMKTIIFFKLACRAGYGLSIINILVEKYTVFSYIDLSAFKRRAMFRKKVSRIFST